MIILIVFILFWIHFFFLIHNVPIGVRWYFWSVVYSFYREMKFAEENPSVGLNTISRTYKWLRAWFTRREKIVRSLRWRTYYILTVFTFQTLILKFFCNLTFRIHIISIHWTSYYINDWMEISSKLLYNSEHGR